jgi:D-lactate dehydrogenase
MGLPEMETVFFEGVLDSRNVEKIQSVKVISVFVHSKVTKDLIESLPNLGCIVTRSTGTDHIDMSSCRKRGIVVSNVPTYGQNTVAEHTFALILNLSRMVHKAYERTRRGDFSLEGLRGFDLYGKTIGVVGAGSIGLHVVRIARGFSMRVIVYDPFPRNMLADLLDFEYVEFDRLLSESNVVTIHCPLTNDTRHLFNRDSIARMKPGAILVNTARGGIVESSAVLEALEKGQLAGLAIDVFEGEETLSEETERLSGSFDPEKMRNYILNRKLLDRENVIFTPHIAFNSTEAVERILKVTVENLKRYLSGSPQNVVVWSW